MGNNITRNPISPFPSLSKYRPDIDGLRGVSIIAVVLFHTRVPGFEGGYVGVDVFFVISGFLITSLLLQQSMHDNGIVSFYERRIRRLFPALILVLFFCSVVSALLLLPGELDRFGQSLVSTTLFVPNIFFWRQSSYFAPIAENAPLLHLWSLGVEEQFYLLYPATLLIIKRFADKNTVMIIAILTFASFLLNIWAVESHPSANFYLAPTRAWELLLGAMISMRALPQLRNRLMIEIFAVVGLILVGWSVTELSAESAFPGFNALVPCSGAAMIIYAGNTQQSFSAKILSLRPIVFLGLISYSLYLWHWPLLAFSRRYAIRNLDSIETGAIMLVALLISVLSWKFIEQPFRTRDGVWGRRNLFRAAACLAISTIAIGITFSVMDGFPKRVSPAVRLFEQASEDANPDRNRCHLISPAQIQAGHLCELGNHSSSSPDFIVWGDSHADAMMPAFKSLADKHGRRGLFASYTSCPPIIGVSVIGSGVVENCAKFNDEMLSVIEHHASADVILIAYWSYYLNSGVLVDNATNSINGNSNPFTSGLDRTLKAISTTNRRVWLIQQVPVANFDPPGALGMAERRGIERDFLRLSLATHQANTSEATQVFTQAMAQYPLTLINPQTVLCDEFHCDIEYGGKSLYRDYDHLSTFGALYLRPSLRSIFMNMRPRKSVSLDVNE